MKNKTTMALVLVALATVFLSGYGFAVLTTQKSLDVGIRIITDVDLGIYENEITTEELISINLDKILPGQTLTWYIWIENKAEINLTLSITTQNWQPIYAEGNMTFIAGPGPGFPAGMYPLLFARRRGQVELSLTASNTWLSSEDISFTIVITGTST